MEDYTLFKGKKLSDLFEDIYTNQVQKKIKINSFIDEVRLKIVEKADLLNLLPLISDLMKEAVKNDEQLIKLAQIAQKIQSVTNKVDEGSNILTEDEKKQLLDSVEELRINNEVEVFESEVNSLKKKFEIE